MEDGEERMPIVQGFVALGVMLALGWIIFAKVVSNNPKVLDYIKDVMPTSLYTKPDLKIIPDNIQQVYDERRSML